MPFDPVRDAVQTNSPITTSAPPFLHYARNDSPTNNYYASPSLPPVGSPTLGRRATDLSVLLNAEPEPPPTPLRPSSLSHLLLPDPVEVVQLRSSITRNSRPVERAQEDSYFHPSHPPSSYPQSAQSFEAGPSSLRPITPVSRSPIVSNSRPSSSSSSSRPTSAAVSSTPRTTTSPVAFQQTNPMPSKIPYHPKKRMTPADSVLRPITVEEIASYRNTYGIGAKRLNKRKRGRSSDAEDGTQPASKKLAGDVSVVVEHYNARPDIGVKQRLESPIIGLKNFNNWVKSILITRFAHPALAASPMNQGKRGSAGKVLDMGCGKGGDLSKWNKARIKEYMGIDIAANSVEQAHGRWKGMRMARFDATFAALDCYTDSLSQAFPPAKLAQPFDVVSMQFCMHYAFETIHKARIMLENVSRWLRPGGILVGTIPNSEQLLERLDALPPDAQELSFGNSVYKIRFDERVKRPVFGHKYWFYLQDAVENVPEYIVRWENFVEMAKEYGLHLKYKEEFHGIFEEHQDDPEFGPLMVRMNVVNSDGESSMDEDQWEAANIYIAFAFEKA